MKASNTVRSYSADVPTFLWNRPGSFVLHAMQRWQEAKNIPASDIMASKQDSYIVASTDHDIEYKVSFSTPTDLPSCSCPD